MEKLLILFYLDCATDITSNVGFIVFVQLSLAPATDWILRYRLRVMPTMTDMAGLALATAIPIPFAPIRRKMTKKWLEELVKPYKQADPKKFQGITKAKKLSIDGFSSWLIERDVDVMGCWEECLTFPTPLELLSYWRSQGSPSLVEA